MDLVAHVAGTCPWGHPTTRRAPRPRENMHSSLPAPSSSSIAAPGLSYASVARAGAGQADGKEKDKASDLKIRKARARPSHPTEIGPSLRGLPEPNGSTPQKSQRSAATRSTAGFCHCEAEESQNQGHEVQASPPPGKEALHCAQDVRLRVASRTGSSCPRPSTATTLQGDVGLTLSSEDVVEDMLKECGLLAMAAQEAHEQHEPEDPGSGAFECLHVTMPCCLLEFITWRKKHVNVRIVNAHVQPEFTASRFNDVNICTMQGSLPGQGRHLLGSDPG